MRTVEFEYNIGDKVKIIEMNSIGFVIRLYVQDTGIEYQLVYYGKDGSRSEGDFFPCELELPKDKKEFGYGKGE